jgi:hypothetical protein
MCIDSLCRVRVQVWQQSLCLGRRCRKQARPPLLCAGKATAREPVPQRKTERCRMRQRRGAGPMGADTASSRSARIERHCSTQSPQPALAAVRQRSVKVHWRWRPRNITRFDNSIGLSWAQWLTAPATGVPKRLCRRFSAATSCKSGVNHPLYHLLHGARADLVVSCSQAQHPSQKAPPSTALLHRSIPPRFASALARHPLQTARQEQMHASAECRTRTSRTWR